MVKQRVPLIGSGGTRWLARSNGLSLKRRSQVAWSWFEGKQPNEVAEQGGNLMIMLTKVMPKDKFKLCKELVGMSSL